MNIIGIAILAVVAFSAVLGLIIGLCKGFSRVSSWGMEYLLACLCTILIGGALKENVGGLVAGIISIVIGVASILIFGSTSSMCRAIFRRSKRKKVAQGKKEKGPSGFVDVIFGGVTLAVKGAVITGFIFAFMLAALDLSQLNFGSELAALCASEQYALFKPYLFDCFYLVFIFFAIKFGYRNGISNVVWSLIMIGLVVFAALAAYNLAFNVQSFDGVVASLAEKVQGLTASIEGFLGDSAANLNETIARVILTVGIFVLMLVVVILIGIFGPKLLACARRSKTFYSIDGVLGATVAVIVVAGIMLVVGNILQPLVSNPEEFEFIAGLASYFEKSAFATYFVDNNILVLSGMQPIFDITTWLR